MFCYQCQEMKSGLSYDVSGGCCKSSNTAALGYCDKEFDKFMRHALAYSFTMNKNGDKLMNLKIKI